MSCPWVRLTLHPVRVCLREAGAELMGHLGSTRSHR